MIWEGGEIEILAVLCGFGLIALAAKDIGRVFAKYGLALVSGFVVTGVLAGPYVLNLLGPETISSLGIIDSVALPFIAFAAGAELHLDELRRRLRTILFVLTGIIVTVLCLGTIVLILSSELLPFVSGRPFWEVFAISLLGANILCAKSPSSTIAVIKEIRAKGPFCQTVLGVTIMMDAVVILLFATTDSVAGVLIRKSGFQTSTILGLILELGIDVLVGLLLAQLLRGILSLPLRQSLKAILVLLSGYVAFLISEQHFEIQLGSMSVYLLSEPLLFCMIAGLLVSNYTPYKDEFIKIIEDLATPVFVFFFTAVGVGMELDFLQAAWPAVLILVATRAIGMTVGASTGAILSGDSSFPRGYLGFAFVTQAGLSLGLAKQVGVHFPEWGGEFATLFTAIIVINTLVGPSLFKFALTRIGEAHPKAELLPPDHEHRALIIGVEGQSCLLAKQLRAHGWIVTLADTDPKRIEGYQSTETDLHVIPIITPDELRKLGADQADSIVVMTDSDTGYRICEIAYEHFGTPNLVVRLHGGGSDIGRFKDLGVSIVDSASALVNLLDHFVRSPSATSLLLGQDVDQEVVEVVVGNRDLHGIALRDLHLPSDVLVLAIRRRGQLLLSHGYNRLRLGDEVALIGSQRSLDQVSLRLEE